MILGIIAFAVAVEQAVLHPTDALSVEIRLALAAGVALFTGGMALSLWRATSKLPVSRLLLGLATALGALAAGTTPVLALSISFVGVTMIAVAEHQSRR